MNDLKDFYNTNYKANGAAISVVGDFDSNNMKAALTKLFSGWEKSDAEKENPASKLINIPTENKVL
jgi:predicted Zn-dependent peptidase